MQTLCRAILVAALLSLSACDDGPGETNLEQRTRVDLGMQQLNDLSRAELALALGLTDPICDARGLLTCPLAECTALCADTLQNCGCPPD